MKLNSQMLKILAKIYMSSEFYLSLSVTKLLTML